MKGKQLAMDDALADLDKYMIDREKREEQRILEKLAKEYTEIWPRVLYEREAGTVVIVRQELFRNNHFKAHFYRTVLGFHRTVSGQEAHLVWEGSEEWPEEPPWQTGIDELAGKRWIYPNFQHNHWIKEKQRKGAENDGREADEHFRPASEGTASDAEHEDPEVHDGLRQNNSGGCDEGPGRYAAGGAGQRPGKAGLRN